MFGRWRPSRERLSARALEKELAQKHGTRDGIARLGALVVGSPPPPSRTLSEAELARRQELVAGSNAPAVEVAKKRTLAEAIARLAAVVGDEAPGDSADANRTQRRADPPTADTHHRADPRAAATPKTPAAERYALTHNPKKLAFHRSRTLAACVALHRANARARAELDRLAVPREVFRLCNDIADDTNALAGALDWIRRTHGPGVAFEAEAAALFRERGGVQRDDWSCARARRKAALIVVLLMSPHELARADVTGSTSKEPVLVTAGVPQTLLVKMLRSSQREPYSVRTLQRDLAEIDACTDLLLRWRTPIAHAEEWERRGAAYGVVNRYCIRAGMIREQWRRARNAGEALVKQTMLRVASWMVWRPAPDRGSPVALDRGGLLPAPS